MEVSKIALVCPKCKKPTRVGYEVGIKTKEKVRVCRKCGENIKN
jgi:large subunit ribosomal protein L24